MEPFDKSTELLDELRSSSRGMEIPNGGFFALRRPVVQLGGTGAPYLDMFSLELLMQAVTHAVRNEFDAIPNLVTAASLRTQRYDPDILEKVVGDGARFHRWTSAALPDFYSKEDKAQSEDVRFTSQSEDFMTKTHAYGAILYSRWSPEGSVLPDPRASRILSSIVEMGASLNHNMENDKFHWTGKNLVFEYAETNILIGLALAMEGDIDTARYRLDQVDKLMAPEGIIVHRLENGLESNDSYPQTKDTALMGLARLTVGDVERAVEIADYIEHVNPENGISIDLFTDREQRERVKNIGVPIRNGYQATAWHAMLLHGLGRDEEARARLSSVNPLVEHINGSSPRARSATSSILLMSMAYADLARNTSFFTGVIEGEYAQKSEMLPQAHLQITN